LPFARHKGPQTRKGIHQLGDNQRLAGFKSTITALDNSSSTASEVSEQQKTNTSPDSDAGQLLTQRAKAKHSHSSTEHHLIYMFDTSRVF
jgi:hypothetical protein